MERMIAVCGLDCGPCEARVATQADDDIEKQRVAAKWREAFGEPSIDANYVTCDGCLSGSAFLCGWCRQCPLRICAIARNVATCADCVEYDVCEKLVEFDKNAPGAKDRLAKIKAELKPSRPAAARRARPHATRTG
jgi:hypothetical protein